MIPRVALRIFAALFLAVLVGAPASALQIIGLSVTMTGNTANALTDSGNNRSQYDSATSTLVAPGGPIADLPGSSTDFLVRYASLFAADREMNSGSFSPVAMTSSYQITFTVDNPVGSSYRIDIDTLRIGALTNVDDANGGSGSLTLGGVTGSVDGTPNAALALAAVGPYTPTTTGVTTFNQATSTLQLFSSAPSQTWVLSFTWTSNLTSGRDEVAIRMGLNGSLTGSTADDYPGVSPVGPSTQADDGHFTDVTVTLLTPEPESGSLLALGLLGIALQARARARNHPNRARKLVA